MELVPKLLIVFGRPKIIYVFWDDNPKINSRFWIPKKQIGFWVIFIPKICSWFWDVFDLVIFFDRRRRKRRRSYVLDIEARTRSSTMIQEMHVLDYMGGREWDGWNGLFWVLWWGTCEFSHHFFGIFIKFTPFHMSYR